MLLQLVYRGYMYRSQDKPILRILAMASNDRLERSYTYYRLYDCVRALQPLTATLVESHWTVHTTSANLI